MTPDGQLPLSASAQAADKQVQGPFGMPITSQDIGENADSENSEALPVTDQVDLANDVDVAGAKSLGETTEEQFGTATPEGVPAGEELPRPMAAEELEGVQVKVDRTVPTPVRPGCPLSPRESQILELVSTGMRNPEIARSLGVSPCTVATHMKSVTRKLGARSRPHAVRIALLSGEIGPGAISST